MLLAHKIELQPNEAQKEYLNKACGTVRHCYNQLLEYLVVVQTVVQECKTCFASSHFISG